MDAVRVADGHVLAASFGDGSTDVELYDAAANTWSMTGSLLATRFYFRGFFALPTGKVLVAGGQDSCGCVALSSAELYDPASGTWSATGSLGTARRSVMTVQLADGRVLYATGATGGPAPDRFLFSSEVYDPATGSFSYTGTVNIARDGASGALLHDGRVLMAGGEGPWLTYSTEAELFNPASGMWSITGSTIGVQRVETMVTLADGRVLIAGGADAAGNTLSQAQLYNPATGSWSLTGSLSYPRSAYVMTLLASGKVLIAGGGNNAGLVLPAELYDPATGTWSVTGSIPFGTAEPGIATLASGGVLLEGGWNNTPSGAADAAIYSQQALDVFSGFLAPLDPNPTIWNTGTAGRTYAVKWRLSDATGTTITDAAPGTTISVSHVSCPTGPAVSDPIDYALSSGGSALRYDSTTGQYVYNWASPKQAGCYAMTVSTPEVVGHVALFNLR